MKIIAKKDLAKKRWKVDIIQNKNLIKKKRLNGYMT
jgi:hypothetical protein